MAGARRRRGGGRRAVLGAWHGRGSSSARQKAVEEVGREAWGGSASRRWPGWPSMAASALHSGGDRRSREAGWRWKKKKQVVISEISGT